MLRDAQGCSGMLRDAQGCLERLEHPLELPGSVLLFLKCVAEGFSKDSPKILQSCSRMLQDAPRFTS